MDSSTAKRRDGNKASLIYDQLRARILSGDLASGTALSQLSISKATGISRGPVREAMRRLEQDKLVIARANQGFSIAPSDIFNLEAVLNLHLINITFAIRQGVAYLADDEVLATDRCADMMDEAIRGNDREQWEALHTEFIFALIKHTGERTISLVGQLIDEIKRYRANLKDKAPSLWYSGGEDFKQIAAAARERDGEGAAAHYVEYMGRLSLLILAGVSPLYDAARLRGTVFQLSHPSA